MRSTGLAVMMALGVLAAGIATATDRSIAGKDGGLDFRYAWPVVAARIPALDGWLAGNARAIRAKRARNADADARQARASGYPFHRHSYEETYVVVADTPRALVLLSDGYGYTGGAHGMPVATAIIWDRQAKRRVATGALVDVPRFARLARTRFCAALDRQREDKRGAPVKAEPDGVAGFTECVDMTKQLLVPVSRRGGWLDTVRVVIAPYEAGPYAEGSYVIDLAMDQTLRAAVKPSYRNAFVTK